jgi:hypothetical protein
MENRGSQAAALRSILHRPLSIVALITRARKPKVAFQNIGEGTHATGRKSFLVDAGSVSGTRYLLWKIGATAADYIAVCGANDIPLGPSDDAYDSANADVTITVNLCGVATGTIRVITDGTIANGNWVMTGANGQATLGTTGSAGVFGRALIGTDTTAAAGDIIEIVHAMPSKYAF